MSGGDDRSERELQAFLADDSRVAALYRRLPKDEPDAKLDAAVLARARVAVAPRRMRPRWLPAMSAAAALVIAAGLAYRVGPQVWGARSAVPEKAQQRVAAPASVPQNAPIDATPPPQPETSSGRPMAPHLAEADRQAESDKVQSQKRKTEDQMTGPGASAKQSARDSVPAARNSLRDRSAASAASGGLSRQPAPATALASPPRLDAAPAPAMEAAPAAPAASNVSAAKPASPQPNAFPSASGAAYSPAAASPAPPARAPMRESAQSVAGIETTLYPEHWIADIRTMLKDGRRDDAIRNLDAFRKRYPDYELPDELRELK